MQLNDFDYHLPPELIARHPLAKRSESRLFCLNAELRHRQFHEIGELIEPGDLLVFNDTKVIPARLVGHKSSGGKVEVLIERILNSQDIFAQIRMSKAPRLGDYLFFGADICLEIIDKHDSFYTLRALNQTQTILELIESIGQIPLPPYLHRLPDEHDKERYQTVYAKYKGSVAAPTAGFHFDETLLQALAHKNIQFGFLTLHIGAGTFLPVRVNDVKDHKMHVEYLKVSERLCQQIQQTKASGKRVISVGTTSLRALEAASESGTIATFQGETNIFIYPGYEFRTVDALITNFHLPCSTLLMLVCAFGGYQPVMGAYREAIEQSYRFYSYGDAMFLTRKK